MATLSPPVTAHNLTAWFILDPEATTDHDYDVLEKAIESRSTLVHETGHVDSLLIENMGAVDVFIQAGDIVKGGRQDRVIASDFIVPRRSGRIPVPAFCVEQSRWRRRACESDTRFSAAKEFLGSTNTRRAVHLLKNQQAVWKSVADEQRSLACAVARDVRSAASPSSLQLTYEHEDVRLAVADYVAPLEHSPATAGGATVGVVWAIDGTPSHADCYGNPALFARLWRKLLRAAAIEALGCGRGRKHAGDATGQLPTPDAIRTWLTAESPARPVDEECLPPRTRIRTRRGRKRARIEVFDTALDVARPLHVAVLAG